MSYENLICPLKDRMVNLFADCGLSFYLPASSQNATALAAATFSESTSLCIGMIET